MSADSSAAAAESEVGAARERLDIEIETMYLQETLQNCEDAGAASITAGKTGNDTRAGRFVGQDD
jgi:hypothetical protein